MSGVKKIGSRPRCTPWAAGGLALALALPVPAAARSLYWSSFEVEARLDADGRLHVVERQTMVFDGDWNGGERVFRLRGRQRLDLRGIRRIDPDSGRVTSLEPGSLAEVDRYDWVSHGQLRWRSRLPGDPAFDHQPIVYELDYVLSNVLVAQGAFYRLDHDFAFPDRDGPIERFALELTLDPAWQAPLMAGVERTPLASGEVLLRTGADRLAPGRGFVVTADLSHRGAEAPTAVTRRVTSAVRGAFILGAAAGVGILLAAFFAHERERGRYQPPPAGVDRAWFEKTVLRLRPEEAGALWDQSIGGAEVAAVLARMVGEGKLASTVREGGGRWFKSKVLELELLVERETLLGYERKLIDKLFFGERTKTDTEAIREHYKNRGFSPAGAIRPKLEQRLRDLPGFRLNPPGPRGRPTALLFLAALVLTAFEAGRGSPGAAVAVGLAFAAMLMSSFFGWGVAAYIRKRADRLGLPLVFLVFFVYVVFAEAALLIWFGVGWIEGAPEIGLFGLAAAAILPVFFSRSVLNAARTRDAREAVALRRELAAARRWLVGELARERPDLDDAWLPYLLAFGLDGQVDRWFRSWGAASASGSRGFSTASSSSGGGASWSGGGGAFGGAGATVAWTSAATTMAAGVAAPSSSGGGGGGGGGGGSSGGGGGGGW